MKFWLLILTLFLFSLTANAGERYLNYVVSGGFSLGSNLHISNFTNLPGFNPESVIFRNGFGLGTNFFAGGEYIFPENWLYGKWNAYLNVSYSNMSATFKKNENIGNIIQGNNVIQGISEHSIEAGFSQVSLNEGVIYTPDLFNKIGVKAGFQVGFPSELHYIQKETLIQPANAYFETNKNTRSEFEGDIIERSRTLFGFNAGLRYYLYNYGNLSINPEIEYNYTFTNLIKTMRWHPGAIRGGIALNYRIPVPEPPPAKTSPMPPLPAPPKVVPVTLALNISLYEKKLSSGDTVKFQIISDRQIREYSVLPVIYYDFNSATVNNQINRISSEEDAGKNCLASIITELKHNPGMKLSITASALDSESVGIAGERLNNILNFLKNNNIDISSISTGTEIKNSSEIKTPVLADEYRFVKFRINSGDNLITVRDTVETYATDRLDFELKPKVEPEEYQNTFKGEIIYRNNKIFDMQYLRHLYSFKESSEYARQAGNRIDELIFRTSVANPEGGTKQNDMTIFIQPEKNINETKIIGSKPGKECLLLGYFRFGESEMFAINNNAAAKIRQAVSEGRHITLFPSTDNIGDEAFNSKLLRQRADYALKLLSIENRDKVTISEPKDYLFTNDNPNGRILNRTVFVEIDGK